MSRIRGFHLATSFCLAVSAVLADAAEPRLVEDINTKPASSSPLPVASLGNGLFLFSAIDWPVPHGCPSLYPCDPLRTTWISDGSREGTLPLRERLGQPHYWEP